MEEGARGKRGFIKRKIEVGREVERDKEWEKGGTEDRQRERKGGLIDRD